VRGGTAASLNVAALVSGGTTPYTYSATGLPGWLTLNASTGLISGTAPSARSVTSGITVSVQDATGVVATSAAFSWVVSYPSIAIPNQVSKVSTAVSVDLDDFTAGGTAPYSYVITNKPSWLTYTSATHVLSGTPGSTGTTSNITVAVTDAATSSVTSAVFSWRVISATTLVWSTIADRSSPPNVAISSFGVTGSVSNETASTFTATGLPPGLSISAAGTITGTPTQPGVYQVTVSANDSNGVAIPSAPFTWTVTDLAWSTIPNQSSWHGFSDSLSAANYDSGGIPALTYSASGLPAGMSINSSTGVISGTPTTAGTYSVTVTVTDLAGASRPSTAFTWTVS